MTWFVNFCLKQSKRDSEPTGAPDGGVLSYASRMVIALVPT